MNKRRLLPQLPARIPAGHKRELFLVMVGNLEIMGTVELRKNLKR